MKTVLLLSALLVLARPVLGQIPVIDVSVLAQVIEDVRLATEQLRQLRTEVERLGDPGAVRLGTVQDLLHNLGLTGVGKTLEELRAMATGDASLQYDGNGLYRPPGDIITTADGRQFPRAVDQYRKFDAVTRTKAALEDVMQDTEKRRQQLREEIKATVAALLAAPTISEVSKLSGLLTAQNAELSAIDRERDAALSRVLVQQTENQADAARQELAEREERVAEFRAASDKLSQFLTPNMSTVHIPDPRTFQP
jgi:hypothetical protein